MNYPNTIKQLIECFKKLPGIGSKTAERLAFSVMNLDDEIVNLFSDSLKNIKIKIKHCKICNNFTEEDICPICSDQNRDKSIICVVEDTKNINVFEKVGTYRGVYHVLNGLISPLDGIGPDDININSLMSRLKDNKIKEIIIAVKPSIEGETTALYISKLLEGTDVIVSKIAHGIPLGAEIDYIDSMTLELALEDRKKISE
jgi:recombination protein RecR